MFDWLSQVDMVPMLFLFMVFLHIIADYLVQNDFMAKYKQVKNWEPYIKDGHYKNDFWVVLAVHAFSWAFITFLPLLFYTHSVPFFASILFTNTIVHIFIDDLKCNLFKINLIVDQLLHLAQILITLVFAYYAR